MDKQYNNNTLERIVLIQDITLEHTKVGVTQRYVYLNKIKPVYCISERTYYRYLATPAKRILKKLKNNKQ